MNKKVYQVQASATSGMKMTLRPYILVFHFSISHTQNKLQLTLFNNYIPNFIHNDIIK